MLATIHKMTFRLLRTYLFNGCDFWEIYTFKTITKTMPPAISYVYYKIWRILFNEIKNLLNTLKSCKMFDIIAYEPSLSLAS
ncbi:hypothetical protein SAMN05443550_105245 [Pedobacter hartonius]|uniref:Uncharacterized protein n=1 Tax=Pedobacter hartonius TaxID=425514 RepID=A0A1H4E4M0_9SPHI|nr:hypothetical protein SAMN05443550_105245 [Pedobacter hartonius]